MKREKMISDSDDKRLRSFFQSLPDAEISPWFTRRVLNRLPERRRRIAGIIEYCVYIVALLWLIVLGIMSIRRDITQGITVGDYITYLTWLCVVGALIYAIIEPRINSIVRFQSHRKNNR